MPAKTEKQRRLMMLALHQPEKVRSGNRGVLQMSREQLKDFSLAKTGNPSKKKHG